MKPSNIILEGVTGSTAYGLATENSDVDIKGIYLLPTKEVLSLNFNHQKTTIDHVNPDFVYHEVGKFMKLVVSGNPTVTELLYLDDYTIRTPIGQRLIDNRTAFLSTKAVSNAYRGYAMSQARRLNTRIQQGLDGYDSSLKHRFAKHTRHLWRLLTQAEQLLTTGTLSVRLSDEQVKQCFAFGELQTDEVINGFLKMDEHVKSLESKSVLPGEPDIKTLNDLLYRIRCESM